MGSEAASRGRPVLSGCGKNSGLGSIGSEDGFPGRLVIQIQKQ